MGFSKNIDLIVNKKDAIVADIIRHINKKVDKMETYKEPVVATPEDSVSPEYDPNAPGNENYYDDSV